MTVAKREAILFLFGCSEVNSTWLITSELANQRVRKVLFTCAVYTKQLACPWPSDSGERREKNAREKTRRDWADEAKELAFSPKSRNFLRCLNLSRPALFKALVLLDPYKTYNLKLHCFLELGALLCYSFLCPLGQPCKTFKVVQVSPSERPQNDLHNYIQSGWTYFSNAFPFDCWWFFVQITPNVFLHLVKLSTFSFQNYCKK